MPTSDELIFKESAIEKRWNNRRKENGSFFLDGVNENVDLILERAQQRQVALDKEKYVHSRPKEKKVKIEKVYK